jgi:sulfotransferase family protein
MSGPPDSSSSQPAAPAKPKVIYVMGQGKSGSTILGVALGNCDGVFFAGEMCSWLMTSGRPILGGRERTLFWRGVREQVTGAEELFGGAAFESLERGLSPLRIDRWPSRSRLRERYLAVTEALYRTISERANATHIVDSSHLPLRALQLQQLDGIDLYLVFLVRRTEGIVASHTRHVKRSEVAERRVRFLKTNAHLWVTYLLSVLVFLRQRADRRLLLRHEDFVANPEGVLREILAFADSRAALPDLACLSTGIPFQGNALIRSDTVALKAEAAPPYRGSRLMRLVERPWQMVLARLAPAATGAGAPSDRS